PAGVREAPLRDVQLEGGDLCAPGQRRDIVGERLVLAAVGVLDRHPSHPVRRALLQLLREEALGWSIRCSDPVDPALAGDGAAAQMRQHDGRDLRVVGEDLALGRARVGIDDLLEIRDTQTAAVDLHDLPARCHVHTLAGRRKMLAATAGTDDTGGMRRIWKGAVTFDLVNVPVKVYSAIEDHDISQHQVHGEDGGRLRYQRICEIDGKPVAYADIDRAYVDDDGQTVVLTKKDLEA